MDTNDHSDNTKKIVATVLVLLAVVLITVGVNALSNKKAKAPAATTSTQTSSTTQSTSTQNYKDGTYDATGSYDSPGGEESIKVSVTIKDNTVTNATAEGQATDNDAKVYQDSFVEGYKSLVVGKKISDIHLSRVSGSSLTSQGFNNALDQIKNEAAS